MTLTYKVKEEHYALVPVYLLYTDLDDDGEKEIIANATYAPVWGSALSCQVAGSLFSLPITVRVILCSNWILYKWWLI